LIESFSKSEDEYPETHDKYLKAKKHRERVLITRVIKCLLDNKTKN